MTTRYTQIHDIVRRVPRGCVATYGQIASFVPDVTARMVGYALAGLGDSSDVPWHRIINASGRISLPAESPSYREQRRRLEAEGIVFSDSGRIDLVQQGWREG